VNDAAQSDPVEGFLRAPLAAMHLMTHAYDSCSVTRFFQQSLPKFCSNFTKLRKILPNVGFPNNYVIIMPKNNSYVTGYVIKVEKICTKRYLEILVAFIVLQFLLMIIRLYFLGLAVLFITLSTLLNKKQKCLPK
jgi:hypothetical protein